MEEDLGHSSVHLTALHADQSLKGAVDFHISVAEDEAATDGAGLHRQRQASPLTQQFVCAGDRRLSITGPVLLREDDLLTPGLAGLGKMWIRDRPYPG